MNEVENKASDILCCSAS